ncbi:MAG: hypothetical protein AAFZ18_30980 [Myxococcota bacterium]
MSGPTPKPGTPKAPQGKEDISTPKPPRALQGTDDHHTPDDPDPDDLPTLGPCAVRDVERGRAVLVAVSEAAYARGVRSGMSEAEGRATFAELAVHDREPGLELTRLQNAAELLFAYGPQVEVCPPATLFVEVGQSRRALRRRFGTHGEDEVLERVVADFARIGHRVTAAAADDPDTAHTLAAQLARPSSSSAETERRWRVAPSGRGRAALSGLPLEALAWTTHREDPDRRLELAQFGVCEALRQLGFREVGDIEGMSAAEMGARFGEAGVLLHERARASRVRPLAPHRPAERLEEHFEFDAATEDLEPILFVLRRLLNRLEARLEARQLAAGALTLDFLVEPGLEREVPLEAHREATSKRRAAIEVKLARPTRSAATAFSVAREALGGALPGAVWVLRVVAERSETDRGAQLDLFSRRAQKAEALAELVGRLTAAVGETGVYSPGMLDTHRPEEAWGTQPFSVDAALAPPPAPVRRALSVAAPPVVEATAPSHQPLPAVDSSLSVTAPLAEEPVLAADDETAWPKPKVRRPEDEPLPALPPRPLELLEVPEPARFSPSGDVLGWRGRRARLVSVAGREHLRTEWWRAPRALERDYYRVETEDGRALWVFVRPDGAAFVHGVFD